MLMSGIRARGMKSLIAAVMVGVVMPGGASGQALPIINPSFEAVSRPLVVGEQSNGSGGAGSMVATRFPFSGGSVSWANPVEVLGWRTRLRPFGDTAVVPAGVLHPPLVGGQPFITGHEGQHVMAVQAAQVGQALDVKLKPSTRYRLEFLGGIGRLGSAYVLSVSLIAVTDLVVLPLEGQPGVTRLAITQGLVPPMTSFGTMRPYVLEYTTPAVLPVGLEGKYIGIHLYGSDGSPRVVYDDFRLTAMAMVEGKAETTPKARVATADVVRAMIGIACSFTRNGCE